LAFFLRDFQWPRHLNTPCDALSGEALSIKHKLISPQSGTSSPRLGRTTLKEHTDVSAAYPKTALATPTASDICKVVLSSGRPSG
jgi:hypothetical protein